MFWGEVKEGAERETTTFISYNGDAISGIQEKSFKNKECADVPYIHCFWTISCKFNCKSYTESRRGSRVRKCTPEDTLRAKNTFFRDDGWYSSNGTG